MTEEKKGSEEHVADRARKVGGRRKKGYQLKGMEAVYGVERRRRAEWGTEGWSQHHSSRRSNLT